MSKHNNRLLPSEATKIMGVSAQYVRIRMQRNLFDSPIGMADRLPGKQKWCYRIYLERLAIHLGMSIEKLEALLKEDT